MKSEFVLTVEDAAYTLSEKQQDTIRSLISKKAAKHKALDCHWIYNGPDEGANYCERCALKEIKRIRKEYPDASLDGGWRTEHDSLPYCETCHKPLDGSLTYYGAEQEIEHFLEYNFDPESAADCYSLDEALNSIGFFEPEQSQYEGDKAYAKRRERQGNLSKLCLKILESLPKPKRRARRSRTTP